jgi:hypothetical protein
MTNLNNVDDEILILDRVHNSITSLPNTVLVLARQLFASWWAGIIRESADAANKALAILFL